MENLAMSALFWKNMLEAENDSLKTPTFAPTVISQEIGQKNKSYFPSPKTRAEQNRDFFAQAAKKTVRKKSRHMLRKTKFQQAQEFAIQKPKTTLIFAPHPDDEILCCSRAIANRLATGGQVKVIYFTDGDGKTAENHQASRSYGKVRRRESKLAAKRLGLDPSDLYFLNFPDRQLPDLEGGQTIRSDFTGQSKSSRYSYFPHTVYSDENLEKIVQKIMRSVDPDEVFIPSADLDTHPDHQFVGRFGRSILASFEGEVSEYAVHTAASKKPEKQAVDVQKLQLIRVFQSQFHDEAHTSFMEQFASLPERFEKLWGRVVRD